LRPIYWGVIWFFIGLVGWVAFSVIYGVGLGFGAKPDTELQAFVYLFGLIFFFSLPIAVIAETIRWWKRRGAPKTSTTTA